ncbi:pectinesterase 1-like [Sesamum indicum]|uniref:Pectinesterase n=1 Tax=Sesamum indicum TaxID=4182 RepID=A0A6I9T016_SESIN|nr:pectinesterase 1-like [Sesamum indicum]
MLIEGCERSLGKDDLIPFKTSGFIDLPRILPSKGPRTLLFLEIFQSGTHFSPDISALRAEEGRSSLVAATPLERWRTFFYFRAQRPDRQQVWPQVGPVWLISRRDRSYFLLVLLWSLLQGSPFSPLFLFRPRSSEISTTSTCSSGMGSRISVGVEGCSEAVAAEGDGVGVRARSRDFPLAAAAALLSSRSTEGDSIPFLALVLFVILASMISDSAKNNFVRGHLRRKRSKQMRFMKLPKELLIGIGAGERPASFKTFSCSSTFESVVYCRGGGLLDRSSRPSDEPIPANKAQLNSWFDRNVGPLASREGSLDPAVVEAEKNVTVVRVRTDGSGDFKTVTDAIKSVPQGNKHRVIISIGPGNYTEKVKIDRYTHFITLYGDPNNMPVMLFDGTAAQFGTLESATLTVESDYFSAVNLKIVNSAPKPDGKRVGAQAVAIKIAGEYASFYNCRMYGFQDTLCDDRGKHLFKDCYVEGTVDFIFGSGQSLYLNSEIHVIPGDPVSFIAAHSRSKHNEANGYVFVHCRVTGTNGTAYLARSWFPYGRVIFAYSQLSDAVNPQGWSNNGQNHTDSTVYFGEYHNEGPGSDLSKRAAYGKVSSDAEVKSFISIAYIEGSKWLLPPATPQV